MNDHEESEIMQDFGQILRTVMGSGMQAAEQSQRRAAMQAQQRQAAEAHERGVAQMIGRDFASEKFWKTAGSEAIADRMTLSVELATKHGADSEAARAFTTGADRIRNQYGINVEDINRDHPIAATDRHHALRDALDDYLAGERANAEEQTANTGQERESENKDPEVSGEESSAQDREHETAHQMQAEQHEGEEHLDRTNTETAESKEVSTSQQPGVDTMKADAEKLPLDQHSDASQRVLSVWREKSGGQKNPSIAQAPTLDGSKISTAKRPKVLVGQTSGRQKEQGLSR